MAAVGVIGLALAFTLSIPSAQAATSLNLGTAESFVVLGGSTVTNTGPSVLNGDLGVAPGTAITGFPPGVVVGGAIHANDAVAQQAQADATAAYNVAAGQPSDFAITDDLGGQTLVPGVYTAPESAGLTGALTLDAQSDPDAVWIFQIGTTLTTATDSSVMLINGAQACNVFWQVGSSATLGTSTDFVGTILALTSITLVTGTTVDGRAIALNGAVTLDSNVFVDPRCDETTDADVDAVDADVDVDVVDADVDVDADAVDADVDAMDADAVDADVDAVDADVDAVDADVDAVDADVDAVDADVDAVDADVDAVDADVDADVDAVDADVDAADADMDADVDAADADMDADADAADADMDADADAADADMDADADAADADMDADVDAADADMDADVDAADADMDADADADADATDADAGADADTDTVVPVGTKARTLAVTGLGDVWLAPVGAALLLGGAVLLLLRRNRTEH